MAARESSGSQAQQGTSGGTRGRGRWSSRLRSTALWELVLVVAVSVATFVVAARFDLLEGFERWAGTHEHLHVHAIALAALVGFLGLLGYSWRRLREAGAEARRLTVTERALAETTERYRSLFDYNPNAVFSVDCFGAFVSSNAASERLSGYTTEEIRALDVGALVRPSHAEKTAAAFAQALDRHPQQVETALTHKDGHVVEVSITGLPIIVGDEVVGVHCIAEDITVRKQMERELIRTQLAAEDANEAKSLFLANVSHEVRTPLTTLLGTAEVMLDTDLDPLQQRFAETIHRSGERLLALVSDILDFSKMEAGQAVTLAVPVDLRAVMDQVAAPARAAAERKGLDFECTVDCSLPPSLIGDPARIAQLMTNLLDNAVKFTEAGWIRVSATVTRARAGSVDVLFVVKDSGIGITEEHQDRLFDSFSQADASMTRKYGGTGLGLALCKQLVCLMGGTIDTFSTVGKGSVFSVILPLAVVPPPTRTSARRGAPSLTGTRQN